MRGHSKANGDFFEERILHIPVETDVTAKLIEAALSKEGRHLSKQTKKKVKSKPKRRR